MMVALAALTATVARARLEVVTVSNDRARAEPLLRSCPFQVKHLQALPGPWRLSRKFERLLRYLDEQEERAAALRRAKGAPAKAAGGGDDSEDRVVLFVDAFDVQCLGCRRPLERPRRRPPVPPPWAQPPSGGSASSSREGAPLSPPPLASVEEVFRSFRRPLFFSAEFGLSPWEDARFLGHLPEYPDPRLPSCSGATQDLPCRPVLGDLFHERVTGYNVPDPKDWPDSSPYRFLNSGCFGGTVAALRRFLSAVLTDPSYWDPRLGHLASSAEIEAWKKTDGLAATNYYLRHPDEVTLDFGASICLSAFGLKPLHFELDPDTAEIRTKQLFSKPVCFVHANGWSRKDLLLGALHDARRSRVDPSTAWTTSGYKPFKQAVSGRGNGVWVDSDEDGDHALIDTAQCFRGSGALQMASLCTSLAEFEGLKIQLWRPVQPPGRRRPNASRYLDFLLVAQTDPLSARGKGVRPAKPGEADQGEMSGHAPWYDFELSKYDMRYEHGDCLGWLTTGKDLVFLHSDPRAEAPTLAAAGRPVVGKAYRFTSELRRHYCIFADFVPAQ